MSRRCDDCDTLIIVEQAEKTVRMFGRGLCTICALVAKPSENQNKGDLKGLPPDEMELLDAIERRLASGVLAAQDRTIMTDASGLDKVAQKELERSYRFKRAFEKIKKRLIFS